MARVITVIDAISQASEEMGLSQRAVTQAIGSPDQDVSQLVALLVAVADEVLDEEPYKETLGSGMWIRNATTGALTDRPINDGDQIMFDARLAINGLKFRFLQAKGLEFGEQLRDFTIRMNKLAGWANGEVLDLDLDEARVQ